MPKLTKLDEVTFNTHELREKARNCNPVTHVLDGMKTQVSDDLGIVVARGAYKYIVFVPDAMLGEVRWNRVFTRYGKDYDIATVRNGVIFMIEPITA